jgi:hypothetical protein
MSRHIRSNVLHHTSRWHHSPQLMIFSSQYTCTTRWTYGYNSQEVASISDLYLVWRQEKVFWTRYVYFKFRMHDKKITLLIILSLNRHLPVQFVLSYELFAYNHSQKQIHWPNILTKFISQRSGSILVGPEVPILYIISSFPVLLTSVVYSVQSYLKPMHLSFCYLLFCDKLQYCIFIALVPCPEQEENLQPHRYRQRL